MCTCTAGAASSDPSSMPESVVRASPTVTVAPFRGGAAVGPWSSGPLTWVWSLDGTTPLSASVGSTWSRTRSTALGSVLAGPAVRAGGLSGLRAPDGAAGVGSVGRPADTTAVSAVGGAAFEDAEGDSGVRGGRLRSPGARTGASPERAGSWDDSMARPATDPPFTETLASLDNGAGAEGEAGGEAGGTTGGEAGSEADCATGGEADGATGPSLPVVGLGPAGLPGRLGVVPWPDGGLGRSADVSVVPR